jgi:hypothetical protein
MSSPPSPAEWPVLRQLRGPDRMGRGAAASSRQTRELVEQCKPLSLGLAAPYNKPAALYTAGYLRAELPWLFERAGMARDGAHQW